MTTHERELTEPVDLTTPDGTALNPDAVGWSRRPLHRTSLYGPSGGAGAGRNKQWDYWAVLAGDLLVSVCYADIDYFAFCDVWWTEISTGRTGRGALGGRREEFVFPETVGARPLVAHGDRFSATPGACWTSAVGVGRPRSCGTGAVARVEPTDTSSGCSSALVGRRGPATPRTR